MKITDSINPLAGRAVNSSTAGKTQPPASSSSTAAAPAAGAGAPSSGGIASTSPQLQALQAHIASSGSFNVQKVEAIKQAITSGQFKVNTEKVASELITSVRGLLQSGGSQA